MFNDRVINITIEEKCVQYNMGRYTRYIFFVLHNIVISHIRYSWVSLDVETVYNMQGFLDIRKILIAPWPKLTKISLENNKRQNSEYQKLFFGLFKCQEFIVVPFLI